MVAGCKSKLYHSVFIATAVVSEPAITLENDHAVTALLGQFKLEHLFPRLTHHGGIVSLFDWMCINRDRKSLSFTFSGVLVVL